MAEHLPNETSWSRRLAEWENSADGPAPVPGDWDRLAHSLNRRKRRPGIWWLLSGLLAMGIAGWWVMPTKADSGATDLPAVVTNESENGFLSPLDQPLGALVERRSEPAVSEENGVLTTPSVASPESDNLSNSGTSDLQAVTITEILDVPLSATSEPTYVLDDQLRESTESEEQARLIAVGNSIRPDVINVPVLNVDKGESVAIRRLATPELRPLNHTRAELLSAVVRPTNAISDRVEAPTVTEESHLLPTRSPQRPVIALGFETAVHRPSVRVELPPATRRSESRTSQWAYSAGLRLRLELNDRWSLTTGYTSSRENSEHRLLLAWLYRGDQEVLDADGNARTTYNADFATDNTKAETEVEIVRPAGTELPANFFIRMGVRAQESVRTTSLPLIVAYDQPVGDQFRLRIGTGVVWNRQSTELAIQSRLNDGRGLNLNNTRIRRSEQFLDDTYWVGQLSLGLVYRPDNKWEFVLSPQFATSLSDLGAERNLRANFQQFSLGGGIYYRF